MHPAHPTALELEQYFKNLKAWVDVSDEMYCIQCGKKGRITNVDGPVKNLAPVEGGGISDPTIMRYTYHCHNCDNTWLYEEPVEM